MSTLRFTVSPLMQLIHAVLWIQQRPHLPPTWLPQRWSRVSPASRTLLLDLIDPATHSIPDFLLPLTDRYRPTIETELAVIAATPLNDLRAHLRLTYRLGPVDEAFAGHLGVVPAVADSWRKEPTELVEAAWAGQCDPLLDAVQQALAEAWQVLLAPTWPVIRAVTETDVMYRLHLVKTAGMSSAALELVDGEAWDGQAAQLDSPLELDLTRLRHRIVLAPAVLLDRGRAVIVSGDDLVVGYPCRGRAVVVGPHSTGDSPEETTSEGLGTRHRLIAALEIPQPGHSLAARLGLSKATVSYHLGRLHSSGLVERRRLGREVYYARTPAADRLTPSLRDVRPTPS
ncbi:helix-turn-helix domain-containing protein [Streptomyces sp. SID13031]|uniref:ArsR/SmtB family transcription factor n=1 Tax=Streptomyces sp. SID13031 TaxID=2706046 RepID=UPI0013CCAA9E|nr:helix-turn-helix domain-containing protein [Streptomyces sp. SID13031]NEA37284.1 helix-turn-helix transcriptional regulator [Streptomyces sp. SID13031]